MAFTRKTGSLAQRVEGEFPELPVESELNRWWSDTKVVLDRVRDKVEEASDLAISAEAAAALARLEAAAVKDVEVVKTTLSIVGDAVGTESEQELLNTTIDGGKF